MTLCAKPSCQTTVGCVCQRVYVPPNADRVVELEAAYRDLHGIALERELKIRRLEAIIAAQANQTLEVGDGCFIWRNGSTSITICAETVTVFDTATGKPAIKVPLTQDDVFRALAKDDPAQELVDQAQRLDMGY